MTNDWVESEELAVGGTRVICSLQTLWINSDQRIVADVNIGIDPGFDPYGIRLHVAAPRRAPKFTASSRRGFSVSAAKTKTALRPGTDRNGIAVAFWRAGGPGSGPALIRPSRADLGSGSAQLHGIRPN